MSHSDINNQLQQVAQEFGGLSSEWGYKALNLLASGMSVEAVIAEIYRQKNLDEPSSANCDDSPQG